MFAALASTLAFATLPLLIAHLLLSGYSPWQVMVLRFTTAAVLGSLLLFGRGKSWKSLLTEAMTATTALLAALFFGAALCMTKALESIAPATANVIFYTFPLILLLTSVMRRQQSWSANLFGAISLTFAGIVLLSIPIDATILTGLIWGLGSALSFTAYLLLVQQHSTTRSTLVFGLPVWCAMFSWGLAAIPHSVWPAWTLPNALLVLALGSVPTALALWLVHVSLRSITAVLFGIVSTLEPVVVLFIQSLLGWNLPAPRLVVALVTMIVGIVWATRLAHMKSRTSI